MASTAGWTKDSIRAGLLNNDAWVLRGLVVLYDRQTLAEQQTHQTKENNKVGFSAFDAEILTSFAKQVSSWDKNKYRTPLSPKQLEVARKKILKYSGQLAKIANREI